MSLTKGAHGSKLISFQGEEPGRSRCLLPSGGFCSAVDSSYSMRRGSGSRKMLAGRGYRSLLSPKSSSGAGWHGSDCMGPTGRGHRLLLLQGQGQPERQHRASWCTGTSSLPKGSSWEEPTRKGSPHHKSCFTFCVHYNG